MFVTQQIVPRCKEWLPLATNQLRLRNLIQILAFSIKPDDENVGNEKGLRENIEQNSRSGSYYYTLHCTTMSAPFYTSEKVSSDSPRWREIEVNSFVGNISSSADAFVLRLWSTSNELAEKEESEDQVIAVWGIYLNGLTYLGQNLGADIPLKPNSIVFLMPGGYFSDMNCLESTPKIRYTSMSVIQSDVQPSYTVNTLTRLHTVQQVIRKELAEVDLLKQKISMGDFFRNETRGRTMLRRLLSKNKPRVNHQDYIKLKENVEMAKYRVHILREEKTIMSAKLKELKTRLDLLTDSNHLMESKLMENYRLLMRKVQVQKELKRDHISRRESQLHSKAKLNFRAKQLISELNLIYPIVEETPEKFTICGVQLPNSEDFAGHDDLQISIALGFVTHVVQMISIFLQVPLRYPVIHIGSRSRIIDHITDQIPDSEREFPLYLRGKDKVHFHYAVYLLNKNIAQLRWLCGLSTLDLRNTLPNLSSLVKMKSESSNLDQSNRSVSSSTADVYSSCLSISSPIGSVMSLTNKKTWRGNRLTDSNVPSSEKQVSGHRISKSVGSAKDLVISTFPRSNPNGQCEKSDGIMSNSFSYSLDKGLNEYESSKPPLLDPKTEEIQLSYCKSDGKDEFQESWKDKQYVQLTDDYSDLNAYEFNCSIEQNARNNLEGNKTLVSEEEENPPHELTNEEDIKCDTNIVTKSDVKKCDSESGLVSDNLLESVTTRTEALANQTTSFKMFRSRFNSTMENSS